MNISDLPYLLRPDLENELREFLRAHLSPRANCTKALLLHGEKGVGKRMLLQHCMESTPELQRYKLCPVDLRTPALPESDEHYHRLNRDEMFIAVNLPISLNASGVTCQAASQSRQ